MQRTHSGRPALIRLATAATLTVLLGAALITARTTASAALAPSTAITVRVEGPKRTLVPATTVALSGGTIVKDGVATDSCSGLSAAGALELATRGDWTGTWSASFSAYFLTTINGLAFPSTGAEYWAFWVNNAPASEGICSYDPKPGDSLLFFPDCFGKSCPKNGGVLGVKAAAVAVLGRPFTVSVTAYDDAKGAPSKAVGATVSGGGVHATTAASGTAKLSFTHAGRFTLKVHAAHAIRTETSVCVETAAAKTCG
jgi:Domain of unknown function (DUF4430)